MLCQVGTKEGSQLLLPDIANEVKPEAIGTLDRVGMTEIEVPVMMRDEQGLLFRLPARATAFVSLDDPKAKGIHMSRLFLELQDTLSSQELNFKTVQKLLQRFVETHQGISSSSEVRIAFDYMVQRPALKSQNLGWRTYPVAFSGNLNKGKFEFEMEVQVMYSSTCPCSAALARQLIQESFLKKFGSKTQVEMDQVHAWLGTQEGVSATPHSQRSTAQVKIKLSDSAHSPDLIDLIDLLEMRLGTPVQAAVKREDEQEFARLNGQNLMFCEDAGRRLKSALSSMPGLHDFWIKVTHIESLHPHNAVSIVTKGVQGGYRA
ncbi:MAG: GTP cyclohydrolase FolE2 [Pseudobdellovibrionaceae bacterium]